MEVFSVYEENQSIIKSYYQDQRNRIHSGYRQRQQDHEDDSDVKIDGLKELIDEFIAIANEQERYSINSLDLNDLRIYDIFILIKKCLYFVDHLFSLVLLDHFQKGEIIQEVFNHKKNNNVKMPII